MDGKRRVLIVDDEEAIRLTLQAAFEEAGLEVGMAGSAEHAIELLTISAFDALIVDKNLPGKSGIDLIRWVRERNAGVPAVVMTGYASAESAKEALNLGIDSYLEKPFDDVFEVPEMLRSLVEGGRPGWLPGQATVPLESRAGAPTKPLRILVAAAAGGAAALGEPVVRAAGEGSRIEYQETIEQIHRAFEQSPMVDLVIVDADHYPALLRQIEAIREKSEFVEVAVVTGRPLSLSVLQELILAGVLQLIDRASGDYEAQVGRVVRGLR